MTTPTHPLGELAVLYEPVQIGPVEIVNRVVSTGHQTTLVTDHLPTAAYLAYHRERAVGGVGLIVLEAHAVHHTGMLSSHTIDATDPAVIDRHRALVEAVRPYGTRVFAQLIHNGREAYVLDAAPPVVAPSAVPTERFHLIPRELEEVEIEEIIDGFAEAAGNLVGAGLDGIELTGSHGYLFTQFWSEHTNRRTDRWGGSLENRLRFTTETIRRVREAIGPERALGMRISVGSQDAEGPDVDASLDVVRHLDGLGMLDYWSVVVGSSATHRGASYIAPPAEVDPTAVLARARDVKRLVSVPVVATSRIDTPARGAEAVRAGDADLVGMTRALIADPDLPNKAKRDPAAPYIACIGVNQGCIGRYQQGLPIRCTVNPRTGREGQQPPITPAPISRSVLVVGGGPAGMTAALTAAERGHHVTLMEAASELGGALRYLDRPAVARWIDHTSRRLADAGVALERSTSFEPVHLEAGVVDRVVLATGASAAQPEVRIEPGAQVVDALAVLAGTGIDGDEVVVHDWRGDWIGIAAAETLCRSGKRVELVTAAYGAGEFLQQYIRDQALGRLDLAGVTLRSGFALSEVHADGIRLRNLFSGRYLELPRRPLVVSAGGDASASLALYRSVRDAGADVVRVGDAWAPRSLDDAIREGFDAALAI